VTTTQISQSTQPGTPARRTPVWAWAALGAILLLGGFPRFYRLGYTGDPHVIGNMYYAAGVRSMLVSWHNLFFAAAEPGGLMALDKPPLGFWLQAASALALGVNGFALALPQALAGMLSLAVLFGLVRRQFGTGAGLIAALALAVTPVAVSAERNNTIDGTLVCVLLLAAWAFIRATETGRLSWLLAGAALVGLGFNIKMLQAYLPLPALYAVYFAGARVKLGRKIGGLALASIVLVGVSFAWPLAVDLTPPEQRPYVGSTSENSALELIFGHNGLSRLIGVQRGRRAGGPPAGQGGPQGGAPGLANSPLPNQTPGAPPRPPGQPGGLPPQAGGPPDSAPYPPVQGRAPAPAFADEVGQPGLLRLFSEPLVGEVGWTLPLGLALIGVIAVGPRLRRPLDARHAALVLWGGWLLTCVIFFSAAGLFHAYYMIMLAPPLAALIGAGTVALWDLYRAHRRGGLLLILALFALSAWFQARTLGEYPDRVWFPRMVWALLVIGAAALLYGALGHRHDGPAARAGLGVLLASSLAAPLIWAGLTTFNSSPNVSLPRSGLSPAPVYRQIGQAGGGRDLSYELALGLIPTLQAGTQDHEYLLAVLSARDGAPYILETGRPVLLIGGFGGADPAFTPDDLAALVSGGRLRYFLFSNAGNQRENQAWVRTHCHPVPLRDVGLAELPPGPQGDRLELFDCAAGGPR